MGGLARRVRYTQEFRKAFPKTNVLELSAGCMFNDQGVNNPEFKDIETQNLFAFRGYNKYSFDAANISYADIQVLSPYLKKDQQKKFFTDYPGLKSFTSANLTPEIESKKSNPIPPYIIREMKIVSLSNKKLKIGIVGFSQIAPGTGTGYIWRDPQKVAKEILPKLKKKVDLIIVLAYLPLEEGKELAKANPEIDAIIISNTLTNLPQQEKIGNATLVVNFNETKFLGELRIYFNSKGEVKYSNRYVSLDKQIADDPEAAKLVSESRTAIEEARKKIQTEPE